MGRKWAVVNMNSGETIREIKRTGWHYSLSPNGDLLAATDPSGRIVVWDVRRSPTKWAILSGISAAAGVLAVGFWRFRKRRNVA